MKRFGFGNFNRRYVLAAAGLFLMLLSAIRLAGISREYRQGEAAYQKLGQAAVKKAALPKTDGGENEKNGAALSDVKIDFDMLRKINLDMIGWILFDNNGINYPVLQGRDNEEYLYTLADGTKNPAGSIFMDAWCTPDFTDSHTILYGHNMKNGSMFGSLKKYALQKDYYEENRFFTIYTPQAAYRYEVFAWYEAAKDDMVYQTGFGADTDFALFAAQMKKRSYRDTKVEVGGDDKIVTLSTCSAEGRRFVVHGKQIGGDENETGRADTDIDEDEKGYGSGKAEMAHEHSDDGGTGR